MHEGEGSHRGQAIKGRGSTGWLPGRYAKTVAEKTDDGWHERDREDEIESAPRTEVREEAARSLIVRNDSPDIPFAQSVNPYRGCEHGCSYCFARPTHAYIDLSPGLDFETKIFAKTNAPDVLRRELAKPGYRVSPIALGVSTDIYQPTERKLQLTRKVIEVLAETRHPFSLITKNALVERDIDLLAPMAKLNLVHVYISITSLDNQLSSKLEPRASAPHSRLRAMRALHEAGIPVGVMFAPAIPWVNDHMLEDVLEAARAAGARSAGYVLLRLPHEVAPLFRDWLQTHVPDRAAHVMSTIRQSRGGKDYDATFGKRFSGEGVFADLLAKRFALAKKRFGYDSGYSRSHRDDGLDCSLFVPPRKPSPQGELF